jgi:hypothetical protein
METALSDGAAGAGILAALIADTSADGRERILLLDQSQGFLILAFFGQFNIAFNGDMSRAGHLARGRAGLLHDIAVVEAEVRIPLIRPQLCCRKH